MDSKEGFQILKCDFPYFAETPGSCSGMQLNHQQGTELET